LNPARGKDVGVMCVVIKDTKAKCRITKTKNQVRLSLKTEYRKYKKKKSPPGAWIPVC
jgi:hypothetical protein